MWSLAVADLGEGPRGPNPHPLFLDQPEAQRAEKKCFWRLPPRPLLCHNLDDRAPPYLRASICHWLDSVHLWAVVAKTQTNLNWHLTLYLRMKLKKPVLGMFTVNWSTVGEGPLVPSARTTPTTRTLWPAVLMIVVWLILFVGGCRGTKIKYRRERILKIIAVIKVGLQGCSQGKADPLKLVRALHVSGHHQKGACKHSSIFLKLTRSFCFQHRGVLNGLDSIFFLSVDSAHHLSALFTVESNINLTNHIIMSLCFITW